LPFSVIGVRPAARISGMLSRLRGAVRHGDREILVRNDQRRGHLGVRLLGAAEGLDDRREIGAGIGEEIIDAMIGQRAEEGLSGDRRAFVALGALRLGSHEFLSFVRGVVRL
jgi:hypothetical protein